MSTTKVKKSELNPDLEKVLENVEFGKESLTKYKNFDEVYELDSLIQNNAENLALPI